MLTVAKRAYVSTRHLHNGLARRRTLLTLAIESSCDDSAVAIVEKTEPSGVTPSARVYFNHKLTAKSQQYRGIHPVVALEFHQQNLAGLVERALSSLPAYQTDRSRPTGKFATGNHDAFLTTKHGLRRKPDFITVTRGPGMRSNLSVGLDLAKGLAIAWQIPLVGVNHMQAHALTPRLVSACSSEEMKSVLQPSFPFLSLLVSGGHTMLVHSKSLTSHPILATTSDIAIGDAIDKIARDILPPEAISSSKSTMFGPLLESYAFPNGESDYHEVALNAGRRGNDLQQSAWGWKFTPPLLKSRGGEKANALEYSFSGLCSQAVRFVQNRSVPPSPQEVTDLAREAMRVAFGHLASRILLALDLIGGKDNSQLSSETDTLVVSGGVAANYFLRHVLRQFLDSNGYKHFKLLYPPRELCTDNALMVGWAGIEMYEAGWTTSLDCRPLRKWSLDPSSDDGGILGVDCWLPKPSLNYTVENSG